MTLDDCVSQADLNYISLMQQHRSPAGSLLPYSCHRRVMQPYTWPSLQLNSFMGDIRSANSFLTNPIRPSSWLAERVKDRLPIVLRDWSCTVTIGRFHGTQYWKAQSISALLPHRLIFVITAVNLQPSINYDPLIGGEAYVWLYSIS